MLFVSGASFVSPVMQLDSGKTIEREFSVPDVPATFASTRFARDVSTPATDDAPLFDELRVAYLRGEDTNEWARDGGTGGWAAVEDDWSAQDTPWASPDPSAGDGWVATEYRHEVRHEIRQERGFTAEDDLVDRWTQETAAGGWAQDADPDGWDPDEFEQDDEEPRVAAYVVESENFESIHNHSAYALIERDKDADGIDA